jgi:chromosome segregation ATPase
MKPRCQFRQPAAGRQGIAGASTALQGQVADAHRCAFDFAGHMGLNSALRAEVSRQADIFESTTNHLMTETSWVRDPAKLETERLTREFAHSRDLVDQLRVQRSDAKEESAGLREQVESAALQLRQLKKSHDWLEAQQATARNQVGEGRE